MCDSYFSAAGVDRGGAAIVKVEGTTLQDCAVVNEGAGSKGKLGAAVVNLLGN